MYSIGVRCEGKTANDVTRAWIEERSIVRTWAIRGTLHFIAADDLEWMLRLFGPVFIRSSRKRRVDLGLDEQTGERGVHLLQELLKERSPLTKAEISEELSAKGIPVQGQASFYLIRLAALQGRVCYGPPRGKRDTFVLIEDWLGTRIEPSGEKRIEELARRYLKAFAPANLEDFVSWSGLGVRECRVAWENITGQLVEVSFGNSTAWVIKSQLDTLDNDRSGQPVVRLLPRYDTYLLGYTDRSLIIDPEYVERIYPGGGMIHPPVLVDGKVIGKWSVKRKQGQIEVGVEPFKPLSDLVQIELEGEVKVVSHFLSQG